MSQCQILVVHYLTSKITMEINNSVGHQFPLQLRAALVKALPIRKGNQTAKEEVEGHTTEALGDRRLQGSEKSEEEC